jgi:hypothetical protein
LFCSEPATDPADARGVLPAPEKLEWVLDGPVSIRRKVQLLISEAQKKANSLISNVDSCLLQTDIYGARFMKEVGTAKVADDCFVLLMTRMKSLKPRRV